ncbi:hypothetical protein Y032_0004g1864 [Ancylostoma ceylanicum]|uniref:Uncharacterized protein n=1 Tax=Ancylostoma ceylanicum TaxID=53326 RepID=A0A016VW10_9BILA|nr:hypothetical protein Y032_0004g1864 [Ancylostoma ceylanicum]
MEIFKRIVDYGVRDITRVSTNQCVSAANCGTTDGTHATRLSIEKHREKQKPLHPAFLDLEKAIDHVSNKFISYALR